MSNPEDFLSRWSRRKRATTDEVKQRSTDAPPQDGAASSTATAGDPAMPPEQAAPAAEPAFDLSKLPSIDAITADTDIRAFLAPGVPSELRLAALRRAWSADPKVRDYVGFADYDWDFNTPGALAGFGPLEMTDDLRREVLRIVGGLQAEPESTPVEERAAEPQVPPAPTAIEKAQVSQVAAPAVGGGLATEESSDDRKDVNTAAALPQRNTNDIATQQDIMQPDDLSTPVRRGHGRALPQFPTKV
jgi:Protein of unknown function (DUF3306)